MDITFSCSNCDQKLIVDELGAGTSIDCPQCGKPVYVPTAPSRIPVPASANYQVLSSSRARYQSLPPSIEGGIHSLAIAGVLLIIGLVLFRVGYVAGMVCNAL